jgi:IPT/TIG domain
MKTSMSQTAKSTSAILLLAFTLTLTALTIACGYSSKMTVPVAGTVPTVATLTPDAANAGAPAFTLTVNGSNFGSKAVVNWNGAAQSSNTMFVSSNQLTVAVPASAVTTSGTVTLTVTNPGTAGTGMYGSGATQAETSSPMTFTIN